MHIYNKGKVKKHKQQVAQLKVSLILVEIFLLQNGQVITIEVDLKISGCNTKAGLCWLTIIGLGWPGPAIGWGGKGGEITGWPYWLPIKGVFDGGW